MFNFIKINRKNFFFTLFIGLYLGIMPSTALCMEDAEFNLDNLCIRQEKYSRNGVMFSGPSALDLKIREIIIYNNIKSLAEYINWFKKNIEYKKDKGRDDWAYPDETLQRKYGDCEDLSFLNQAVLRVLGIRGEVLSLMRMGSNHAVCVFKIKGKYNLIDNNCLVETPAGDFKELAGYIFLRYGCYSLCRVDFQTKKLKSLYKRSDFFRKT
ncbi:MAG: transglutaminase-like domain-containing protein [Candidatus Omnitrophota bacterium]